MKPTATGFSKVGLAYIEQYELLEKGRAIFLAEWEKLLELLNETIREKIRKCKIKVRKNEIYKKEGCINYYLDNNFADVIGKKGKDVSGIQTVLGTCEERPFGFYSLLWFKQVEEFKDRKEQINREIEKNGINIVKGVIAEEYLNLYTSIIDPKDTLRFNYKTFTLEAEKLPSLFLKADKCITEFYNEYYRK